MGSIKKYLFKRKGGGSGVDLTNGLLAYYGFEDNANDIVNAYNGVNGGGTPLYKTGGKIGKYLNLFTPYIDFPYTVFDMYNSTFSFSFWNARSDSSIRHVFKTGLTNTQFKIEKSASGDMKLYLYSDDSNYRVHQALGQILGIGTWHHYVVTFDGFEAKIYIDGVEQTLTLMDVGNYIGISSNSEGSRIGDPGYLSVRSFDELGVWKGRVLGQSEVDVLYNNGLGLTYPFII